MASSSKDASASGGPSGPEHRKSSSSATRRRDEFHLELGEAADQVTALPPSAHGTDGLGVIGSFDKRLNRSVMSLGSKSKAEKVLDADPQPRLACLYLVSGLGKVSIVHHVAVFVAKSGRCRAAFCSLGLWRSPKSPIGPQNIQKKKAQGKE